MANTVLQIRRSSVAGRTPNTTTSANTQFINQGELALNMADFKMFSSNGTAFFEIGANTSTKFVGNSTASGLTANSTGIYSPLLVANVVALNVTTIVSGGTTTTMTASSTSYQHITGTSTQTIKLPDLTTIPTGSAYIIDNDSTSNVTITDSAGTTLIVATTGMAGYIYSMSNATATGNWGGYAYLPVGAQWGDAGLSYRGYFAVGNTTTANTFVINSTALSTVFSATFSNTVTISNNITFSSGGRIVDSTGSQGTSGQVLTSNGTGNVYWSTVSGGGGSVNVNSTYNFTNTITFSNSISLPVGARILDALGSQGTAGQVLTSNGTGNVYWSTVSGGGGSVNTAAQYTFTNTISFSANVNIVGNATSTLVVGNTTVYTTVNAIAVQGSSTNTTVTANGFVSTFDGTGNLTVPNTFYVGNSSGNVSMGGTQNYAFGNLVALFSGSGNTSLEFAGFIANTGNNASVSFSVYDTSTGPNGNNFVIIGMNGNNFAQPWWSINGKSDGYVYTGNTNLSVGTQGNNYLNFFAGNTFANNEMMRINPNYTMTTNATMTQQKYSGQIYAIQNGFALT